MRAWEAAFRRDLREYNMLAMQLAVEHDRREREYIAGDLADLETKIRPEPARTVEAVIKLGIYLVLMHDGGVARHRRSLREIGNLWLHPRVMHLLSEELPCRQNAIIEHIMEPLVIHAGHAVQHRVAAVAGQAYMQCCTAPLQDTSVHQALRAKYVVRPENA